VKLSQELPMMGAALVEVSQVPPGQLNELDNEWAQHVRELSYDMEDAVDEFMVRVYRCEPASGNEATIFKKIAQRTVADEEVQESSSDLQQDQRHQGPIQGVV
jgi:hypothetical protein